MKIQNEFQGKKMYKQDFITLVQDHGGNQLE